MLGDRRNQGSRRRCAESRVCLGTPPPNLLRGMVQRADRWPCRRPARSFTRSRSELLPRSRQAAALAFRRRCCLSSEARAGTSSSAFARRSRCQLSPPADSHCSSVTAVRSGASNTSAAPRSSSSWTSDDRGSCLVGPARGVGMARFGRLVWAPPAAASTRACGSPAHGSPKSFSEEWAGRLGAIRRVRA
jgi:hypothetical protein